MSILHDYIKDQPSRPMREWAERFGISRPHLIAIMSGERSPSIEVARRINAATGGNVPITSWPKMRAIIEAAGHQ